MTQRSTGFAQRAIAGIYSFAAKNLYEPIVVRRAFPLFGGNLNELALEQGRAAVAAAEGGPILDMPVGTAYFAIPVARAHEGLVTGADIAAGMVHEAAGAAREAGASGLQMVQANAHALPFQDASFAAILCTNGLQVMPGLGASVAEMERVLKPGGTLFVSVVTLPMSRLLPSANAEHLPTMLRSGMDVAEAISAAGIYVTTIRHERLATLIEAVKPAP
ncbi:MAG: class I SAM-dependent methyltransferase [Actinomycetota bacterium]